MRWCWFCPVKFVWNTIKSWQDNWLWRTEIKGFYQLLLLFVSCRGKLCDLSSLTCFGFCYFTRVVKFDGIIPSRDNFLDEVYLPFAGFLCTRCLCVTYSLTAASTLNAKHKCVNMTQIIWRIKKYCIKKRIKFVS